MSIWYDKMGTNSSCRGFDGEGTVEVRRKTLNITDTNRSVLEGIHTYLSSQGRGEEDPRTDIVGTDNRENSREYEQKGKLVLGRLQEVS